jgi:ABC-type antimicrobial peptide transport system permease subunit
LSAEERAKMLQALRGASGEARSIMLRSAEWPSIQAMIERLTALPGVRSVAVADAVPFTPAQAMTAPVRGEDQPESDARPAWVHRVSDRYFDAMGMTLVRGRAFQPEDRLNSRVVIISEALDRRAFGGDGMGRKLGRGASALEVIGVVANVKQRGMADADESAWYLPLLDLASLREVVVRTTNETGQLASTVRQAIETLDRPMFVIGTAPLSDLVASTIAVERSRALLSAVYGLVALLLASVGLYGLAARLVAERRREIGIRVALGAAPRDVRRLVMTDAWLIVGIGLIVGVPTAIVGSRFAEGLLYGVTPAAPHVIAVAVGALAIAAITATIVPAWRANRVDPVVVLREE